MTKARQDDDPPIAATGPAAAKPKVAGRRSRVSKGDDSDERPTRANGRATRAAVREVAVRLFHERGYQNVSLRLLAQEVGIQAGSLYNHISTKQDLLFFLLKEIMEDVLAYTLERLSPDVGPIENLQHFVETHLEFHTHRLKEIYIGNSELRNLDPENYRGIVALRRQYFDILLGIVEKGSEMRLFTVADTRAASRIVMGMLNGVSGWYKLDGPLSQRELIEIYLTMIFRALGAPPAISEAMIAGAGEKGPGAAKAAR